ncbi:MAG: TolC family protein [Prevotella sp.]|nr:TolC family protein [Prevotella sp.]
MHWKKNGKAKRKVKWLLPFYLFTFLPLPSGAQRMLTLDSCRALALRNNKQLSISKVKQEVAANLRRSARTKYLPHVSAIGTYQYTSEEISLLNSDQKSTLSNLGTGLTQSPEFQTGMGTVGQLMTSAAPMLSQLGLSEEQMLGLSAQMQQLPGDLQQRLNGVGQRIVDAFRTDTRNIWAGSIMLTQPVFMGGSIVALNRMADISEQLAQNGTDAKEQATIYATDKAYWQVVSLRHKQRLAQAYLDLVKKLDENVHKMIDEGVATRSDGLSVDVKVNEAEMTLTKVNDGLVLSKMLLCQTIGLPVNEQIVLPEEEAESISAVALTPELNVGQALENRPELKQLENMTAMSRQVTNILKAGNLPQVALMGGYAVSNPNVLNGFEKKFAGFWNVGLLVRIPIWNWGDVLYKVRASKGATTMLNLELEETKEKIELQATQNAYQMEEANKRLAMAETSVRQADENLRTANLGFSEGVITPTTVMEAQTAWLQAKSQMIDAEIDVRLSQVNLRKALGTLTVN